MGLVAAALASQQLQRCEQEFQEAELMEDHEQVQASIVRRNWARQKQFKVHDEHEFQSCYESGNLLSARAIYLVPYGRSLAVTALLFQLFQHVHLSTAQSASSVPNTGGHLPRRGTHTNSSSSHGADIPAGQAWWSGPRSARSPPVATRSCNSLSQMAR